MNIPEITTKLFEFRKLLFSLLAKYPELLDIFDFTLMNPIEFLQIVPLSTVFVEKALSELFIYS